MSGTPKLGQINQCYFDTIDRTDKAYWLGFLAADGSVETGPNWCVRMMLKQTDVEHLVKFRTAVRSEHRITFINGCASLRVTNKRLVTAVIRQGIVPRKTTSVIPAVLADRLMRHYWRGVFDGDGCIGQDGQHWQLRLSGNEKMVEGFAEFARPICGTRAKPRKLQGCQGWIFAVGGNIAAPLLGHELYRHGRVFLARKRERYHRMMSDPHVRALRRTKV